MNLQCHTRDHIVELSMRMDIFSYSKVVAYFSDCEVDTTAHSRVLIAQ